MSRDIFGLSQVGEEGTTDIFQVEARDAAKDPTRHWTSPYNKGLSSPVSTMPRLRNLALQCLKNDLLEYESSQEGGLEWLNYPDV